MRITNFTDYALRTLMYLSVQHDRRCTTREIAEFYRISINHIVKVVHCLATQGYIESHKGKGGGIKLKRKPEHINLKKLFIELEPDLNLVECMNAKKNTCGIVQACGLNGILEESLQSFLSTLSQYTLADTLKNKNMFMKLGK